MADYEQEWQQRHQELLARIEALKDENQDLRRQLEVGPSVFDEIRDEQLQARLTQLRNSPLDTLIREAGVVLENRLRMASGVIDKHGTQLVDAVLAPQGGALRYSVHMGEQEGVRMLYRGAMQFIRNPPMHKLIEYPESTARLFIRLIDALLQLLAEGEAASRDDVIVDDIRRVLTRIRIPKNQQLFYLAIYGRVHEVGAELECAPFHRQRWQRVGGFGNGR